MQCCTASGTSHAQRYPTCQFGCFIAVYGGITLHFDRSVCVGSYSASAFRSAVMDGSTSVHDEFVFALCYSATGIFTITAIDRRITVHHNKRTMPAEDSSRVVIISFGHTSGNRGMAIHRYHRIGSCTANGAGNRSGSGSGGMIRT